MNSSFFQQRLADIKKEHDLLLSQQNLAEPLGNGIYKRYKNPVLTAAHAPITWRYDLNPQTNPFCMERIGINAAFNAGAIKWNGKYLLLPAWKATTVNRFLLWPKVPTELIISAFGNTRF
jgi:4-O-beta-D-mannosyl-D-glucose phosphorylase